MKKHRTLILVCLMAVMAMLMLGYYIEHKDGGGIRYKIIARNVGSEDIDEAEIRFVNENFYFSWGFFGPNVSKSYSSLAPRPPPKNAVLAWVYKDKQVIKGVTVPPRPAEVVPHGTRIMKNGRWQDAVLVLRFNIDPHTETVEAVWSNEPSHARSAVMSRPGYPVRR